MNQETTIAVLGGGGRTGKFLVSKLIDQGYRLKVLLRTQKISNFVILQSRSLREMQLIPKPFTR